MSRKLNIHPGSVFGRWTILKMVEGTGRTRCLCRCSCGTKRTVKLTSMARGRSKSCGCLRRTPRTFTPETRAKMSAAKRLRLLRSVVGLRYGRLVVLADAGWTSPDPSGKRHRLVLCRCDCGNEKIVRYNSLVSGAAGSRHGTKSCGCLQSENGRYQGSLTRDRIAVHGESHPITPEYRSYTSMRNRCLNKNNRLYPSYGGRGIRICRRWMKSYLLFLEDMGRRPSLHHSLDRKNNDGNYTPRNCRWATPEQQNRNRGEYNHRVTWNGQTKTISEWASELHIPYHRIWRRLRSGHEVSEVLSSEVTR